MAQKESLSKEPIVAVTDSDTSTGVRKRTAKALLTSECGTVSNVTPHCDSLLTATKETKVACVSKTEAGDCKSTADTQHVETTESSQFSVTLLMETKRATRTERLTDEHMPVDDEDSKSTAERCTTATTVAETTAEDCDDEEVSESTARKKQRREPCLGFTMEQKDFDKYQILVNESSDSKGLFAVLRGKLPFRLVEDDDVTKLTLLRDLGYRFSIQALFLESRFGIRRGAQEILFQAATDKPVLILDIDKCIAKFEMEFDLSYDECHDDDEHKPLEINSDWDPNGVMEAVEVWLRPGLIEFLREVRRLYRVVLFTAAADLYHGIFEVLRKYFRENGVDFDLIFTRDESVTFWRREGVSGTLQPHMRKDPTRLGFSPQFGVVLDDRSDFWAGEWAANTLSIPPYTAKGPADDCLKQAADILTRVATHPLSAEGDIRYALHGISFADICEAEKHLGRVLSRKRATDRSGALQATRDVCLVLALKNYGLDPTHLRLFEELLLEGSAKDPVVCSWNPEDQYLCLSSSLKMQTHE